MNLPSFDFSSTQSFGCIVSLHGWSMTDIAAMAAVDKSTISRIWYDENWIDHVKGYTLQALINTIPGVSEAVSYSFVLTRIKEYCYKLEKYEIEILPDGIVRLYRYVSNPNIIYTLHTIEAIASMANQKLFKLLPKFWDAEADKALSFVFGNNGIFVEKTAFQQKCLECLHNISMRQSSFYRNLSYMTLVHHLLKIGYESEYLHEQWRNKRIGFEFRSYTIAQMIKSDDYDLYYRYKKVAESEPFQKQIEKYAYPSYCGDFQFSTQFIVPKNVNLIRSAKFFINELKQANTVYTQYLLEMQLPILLAMDKNFGGLMQSLIFSLRSIQYKWENNNQIIRLIHCTLLSLMKN